MINANMVGRRESPIDPRAPFADFANGLRALRADSMKTYDEIAAEVNFCRSVLCTAASGRQLPTWEVTSAYVRACGGSEPEWMGRWELEARRRQRRRWRP
ncbi:helix-turn-helix domain-containing protein [Dactylosporangium sp. NPDC005572]|uniref:helix-turn-helix domain-containing protein n=1 Tax=Dactylosporangium sp. NPDC005572 TaxID=3156889 RepID=UPI0033A8D7A8